MTVTTLVASLFLFAGIWRIGRRERAGFVFTYVGECIWCVVAINLGMYDLAAVCGVFAGMAFLNWRRWGREGESK